MAIKYHWSREEILGLPNWERVAYLNKIIRDAEEERRALEEAEHGGKRKY